MLYRLIIFFISILCLDINTYGQDNGKLFVKNFNRVDYKASISNFDILQDNNGLIYAANYDGVLIYDAKDWKLIQRSNKFAVTCIAKDSKNRIYTGSDEDFGYLQADAKGKLNFTSLLNKVPDNFKFTSVRRILTSNNKVYFVSGEAVFILDKNEQIQIVPSKDDPFLQYLFNVDNHIYGYKDEKGLICISDSSYQLPFPPSHLSPITFMASLPEEKILIGTYFDGLFESSGKDISKLENETSKELSNDKLITGIEVKFTDSVNFILGTLENGIVKINNNMSRSTHVNKSSGLQSDIIKKIAQDDHHGLWAAMQEGISHIELYSPWNYWDQNNGFEGTPWDIIKHKDTLYLGTTKGLFYMKDGKFQKVSGISGKVWSLGILKKSNEVETVLLAGTEKGLFEINGNESKKILILPEITKLYSSSQNKEVLYAGHWAGISEISFINNKYQKKPISSTRYNTKNSMFLDSLNHLWVSSKFIGVNHFIINDSAILNNLYNQKDGLHDINKINIIKNKGNLLFTTDYGIYKAIDKSSKIIFQRDSSLIKDPINIGVISKAPNSDYFASVINEDRTEHVERFHKVGNEYLRETIPFKRLPEMEILAIYPEENGIVWIAGSEGLFRYDSKVKKDYTLPFNTVISKAAVRDSIIFHGFYPVKVEGSDIPGIGIVQPEDMQPTLTYDDNSITFEYSATSYEVPEKNQFSYYLENNDRGWSSWSTETKKEYNNLDPGEYTFFVKSKNIYGTEGRLATYKFKVLAPWYQTAWAYALWTVLAGFIVWFITIAYSVRVRTQRKKLQLIVADRTYEVMSQKKEIEHQNHLLKAKNEEISFQKDDIQKKNIQLRESQEEILSMNQKLTELNMYLEKKVEKRTSKIKATLKQLQQINGELDTFVYRASHDLKGPISRINGITSLAKLESPDDINLKYFGLIEDTAKDMETLLSKLAQVHEIINTTPHQEEIDIPTLLSEVRDSVKFLDRGQTKYTFDLNQIIIVSDHYLLSIIIKNLIENALIFRKATNTEPHHIHISTSAAKDVFEIKIRDNGIGIHSPHLNMIFQMFFRGSDKSKGSGLGLYLVKMCVDKLKASIAVESKENEFTEFTISIQNSKRRS